MGTSNYIDEFNCDAVQQIRVRGLLSIAFMIYPNLPKPTAHAMAIVDPVF